MAVSNWPGVMAVMMTIQAGNRSAPTSTGAQWSLTAVIRRSSSAARGAAVVAATVALLSTLDGRVPFATGVVLVALLPAALVDLIDRRLPNRLVGAAAIAGLATSAVQFLLTDLRVAPAAPLLGALGMAGPLLVTHLVRPAAMGFGDVKLAVVAGAAVGIVDPVLGLTALAVGSAATSLAGLTQRRRTVAFGPGLLGGAIFSVLLVVSPLDPLGTDHVTQRHAGAVSTVVTPPDTPRPEGDQP